MVTTESLEGVIDEKWWFHFDLRNDVLYVSLLAERETPSVSEETPDGTFLVRRESDDAPIGFTVVSWWKRFGSGAGSPPDSLSELSRSVEQWTRLNQAA
jgi:hypothetical protein